PALRGPEAARKGIRANASRGMRMITFVRAGMLACLVLGLSTYAVGQDSPPTDDPPAESRARETPQSEGKAAAEASSEPRRMTPPAASTKAEESGPASSTFAPFRALIPSFSGTTITWIAVVLILALLLQTRPLFSWLNLDGLMLALAAVALAFRSETAAVP